MSEKRERNLIFLYDNNQLHDIHNKLLVFFYYNNKY